MLVMRPHRGFTLIELMIAVVLLALLLGLGLPSFSQWLQNSQIRTAADSTLSGLQQARAEAVRRNTLVEFVLTATPPLQANTPAVAANAAGPHWMVRVFQVGGVFTSADYIRGRSNTEGTPNATFAANQASWVFSALGRGCLWNAGAGRCDPPPADLTINITNAVGGANRPLRIVVTPGGQIRMCDPNLPAGNVQSCAP